MDDFKVDRTGSGMTPEHYEKWLSYKERGRNQLFGLVGFFGVLGIVAGTIILLSWSPWN